MYESMKKDLYWLPKAKDIYATVHDCRSCVQNRTHNEIQWQLKWFSAERPLEYIGMDTLKPPAKNKPH